jgi:hypothetical protein
MAIVIELTLPFSNKQDFFFSNHIYQVKAWCFNIIVCLIVLVISNKSIVTCLNSQFAPIKLTRRAHPLTFTNQMWLSLFKVSDKVGMT